jgi:small multidrug resistance pump
VSFFHDLTLSRAQAWVVLALTIDSEVSATLLLKVADGFTRPLPAVGSIAGFALAVVCLAKVLEVVPTSIAYTVWTGAGSTLVAAIGVRAFEETITTRGVAGVALVIVGVVILNFSGATPAEPPM